MKNILTLILLLLFTRLSAQITAIILSPDGTIRVVIDNKDQLSYSVYYNDQILVQPSRIKLTSIPIPVGTSKLEIKKNV